MKEKLLFGSKFSAEEKDVLGYETVAMLKEKNKKISSAESCTGGLLAKRITDVNGASRVFEYGIVSYADRVKNKNLGVNEEILKKYFAVSEVVAVFMAKGALYEGESDIGVSITGIAGPETDNSQKKVGTVYIALCDNNGYCYKKELFIEPKEVIPNKNRRDYIRYVASSEVFLMTQAYLSGNLPLELTDAYIKTYL